MSEQPHIARRHAIDVLLLADIAGMPDSYWQTDRKIARARETLGIGESDRHDWEKKLTADERAEIAAERGADT